MNFTNRLLTKYWLHLAVVIILANFVVVRVVKYFIAAQTCYTRDQVLDSAASECLVILNAKVYAPPLDGGLHKGNSICHTDVSALLPASHLANPSNYLKEIYLKGEICAVVPTATPEPTAIPTDIPPTEVPPTTAPTGQPASLPTATPFSSPEPTAKAADPTATTIPGQPTPTRVIPPPRDDTQAPTHKPTLTSTPSLVISPTRVVPPQRDDTRAPIPTPFPKPGTAQSRNLLIIISDLLTYFGLALVVATVAIGILLRKQPKPIPPPTIDHIFVATSISPTVVLLDSGTDKITGILTSPSTFSGRVQVKGVIKIGADSKPYIAVTSITPLTP